MAELLKLKQIRNGHRTHAKKLIAQCSGKMTQLQDMKTLLASLEKKQTLLEKVDADILTVLTDEGDIAEEIDNSSEFMDRMIAAKTSVELTTDHFTRKSLESVAPVKPVLESRLETKPVVKSESQIKLPKITLKSYDGSLLTWSSFWGQFDVAVHKNDALSEIQKFTYLKSLLSGEAERAIESLTVVKQNYQHAVDVLTGRFGNKQTRIAAHMNELRTLRSVQNIADVTGLRKLHDTLELNISNLKELSVDVSTYSSLLIAIIFDSIPEELRIKISLKFGSQVGD